MRECYSCGSQAVIWDNDFDFSDFGYEGDGIVQVYHCMECGTQYELRIPSDVDCEERRGRCHLKKHMKSK